MVLVLVDIVVPTLPIWGYIALRVVKELEVAIFINMVARIFCHRTSHGLFQLSARGIINIPNCTIVPITVYRNVGRQVQMVVAYAGNALVGIGLHIAVLVVGIFRAAAVYVLKAIGIAGIVVRYVGQLVAPLAYW